jgi:hypothetical protein
MKFVVKIRRVTYAYTDIVVSAKTAKEAKAKAIEKADAPIAEDYNYEESGDSYEAVQVAPVE